MQDSLLEQQPQWRYCRVRAGEKKPYPANWQNQPLTLDQVDSENIGLILGPKGLGICAIDFDGTSAWRWLQEQGIDYRSLPITPTWTSGKTDRCQMAFTVPEEIWSYISTKKITLDLDPTTGKHEGFEFRWAGAQSVLPPSIHPETKQRYHWIIKPNIICSELPLSLLELWVKCCEKTVKDTDFSPEVNLDDLDENTIHDISQLLKHVKERYFALTYDDWCSVTWATAHAIGRDAASVLLPQYWPEQKPGEYRRLLRTWNKARSPTIGTLRFMAGLQREPEIKQEAQTGSQAARYFLRSANKFKF